MVSNNICICRFSNSEHNMSKQGERKEWKIVKENEDKEVQKLTQDEI